ncbi:IDEAL domain-containing protein [Ectobacillus sp. JY-23]|uniref:IDEAL domain-containing protein n=1 Tax=Ectobacillus sp. JY-23 TaxID=2933872 RepID=UPI001FF65A92|nr:IDEAL domain-containing protein [Ectobacillus sp. JY-23]UOY93329.1 IDEAL domain-containing protein [Ectobacillus sp. JY-23]
MEYNSKLLKVGDWVRGEAPEGELIHGYIESMDALKGIVKVNVVVSDNEAVVGKRMHLLEKRVEKLAAISAETEEQLAALIDMALLTEDREWFMELTAKLNAIKERSEKASYTRGNTIPTRERIFEARD